MGIISRIIQAIRSFLNRRKKRILLSQKEEVIKLNELVQSLKNHPHYLIEREKFSIISKVRKTYLPNLKGIENEIETKHYNALQEIFNFRKTYKKFLNKYNNNFIQKESVKENDYFNHIENNPLTKSQIKSVLTDEENTLIVAGAGSGKTSVIISKIGYLLKKKIAKPENILILTFTNDTKEDLILRAKERLPSIVETDELNIMNFHQLGLKLRRSSGVKSKGISDLAGKKNEFNKWIGRTIGELCKEKKYKEKIEKYFTSFFTEYKSGFDFDTQGEYFSYLTSTRVNYTYKLKLKRQKIKQLNTLKNDLVKSFEECEIANFLFLNQIKYTYEKPFHIDLGTVDRRNYKPDFTIINSKGEQVYLEHFALDEKGNAPTWFAPGYAEKVEMKKELLKKVKSKCIFTYSYQKWNGTLIDSLREQLIANDIELKPLSPEEIYKLLSELKEINSLAELIQTFLNHYKSEDLNIKKLRTKTILSKNSDRANAFLDIFEIILQKYQDYLDEKEEIDFNDMINETEKIISKNPSKVEHPFNNISYVLVDEFQDISFARYHLIKSLRKVNSNLKFYCVGDDWQSIYMFAGSRISIMQTFEDYFGISKIEFLEDTFRFPQSLVNIASEFIQKNKKQYKKTIKAFSEEIDKPLKICNRYFDDDGNDISLVNLLNRIQKKDPNSSVFVLGRYNFIKPDNFKKIQSQFKNLKIEYKTIHKSKGLQSDYVIILNVNKGKYGFPSEITDDPLLGLVMQKKEMFPFAEERRVFYVALTRTKKEVYLVVNSNSPSDFVDELSKSRKDIVYINMENYTSVNCPKCKTSKMAKRTGKFDSFYSCTNFPMCEYKVSSIPKCSICNKEETLIEFYATKPSFVCISCKENMEDANECVFPF